MTEKFEYSYTAPTEDERMEVESIRRKYIPQEKRRTDLERLRALDKKVKNPPLACALTIGIIGALIFGLGMTFSTEWENLALGIPLCVLGAVIVGVNFPIYNAFLAHRKKKYAKEILELSDKLLGNVDKKD